MQTSEKGIALIKESEGFVGHVYDDNGKPAIGYGHDLLPGEQYQTVTLEQADALLRHDLASRFEPVVTSLVPPDCTQGQFDCLVSFTYNLGPAALKKLLSHGFSNVPDNILDWDHVNRVVNGGLLRRRQRELALFNS